MEDIAGKGGFDMVFAGAIIVRQIFKAFASGQSPRQLAKTLNAEGVPGPQGKIWTDTTIRGYATRGTGILNNELYVGRLVWNRLRYIEDPDTGKRVSRPNPRSDWIVQYVPDLGCFNHYNRGACGNKRRIKRQLISFLVGMLASVVGNWFARQPERMRC